MGQTEQRGQGGAPKGKGKFAIAAGDASLGVLDAFVQRGWEPIAAFTVPGCGEALRARAEALGAAFSEERLREARLAELGESGCSLLVVAGYDWRVVGWEGKIAKAVNFHPAPLPVGRGPMPLPWAILEGRQSWGVACHALSDGFDEGPILAARGFPMSFQEDFDTLSLKCQRAAARLAMEVGADLDRLWERKAPQAEGEGHHGFAQEADRSLLCSWTPERIDRTLRAFGSMGCLMRLGGHAVLVGKARAWREPHALPLGSLDHADGARLVLAVDGGFLALLEWRALGPGEEPSKARAGR